MHRQLAANFLRLFDDEGGNHSSILIHQNFHPGVEGVTDQPVHALAIFNIVVKLGAVQRLKPFRTQSFKSLEHLRDRGGVKERNDHIAIIKELAIERLVSKNGCFH